MQMKTELNYQEEKNSDSINNKSDYEHLKYDYSLRLASGVILLLNCPSFMQFGMDNSRWRIGQKFMGIKLIPYGSHYISYSLSEEDYAIKQGFFIEVNKNKLIHIRKWDNELEDFVILKEEDEKNFSIGITNLEFDAFLGNYPFDQIETWKELSNYITGDIIDKIQPISKKYITTSREYKEIEENVSTSPQKNISELIKLKRPDFIQQPSAKENSENLKSQTNKNEKEPSDTNLNVNEQKEEYNSKRKAKHEEQSKIFREMQENINKSLSNFDDLKSNLYFTDIPKKKHFLSTEKIEHSLITKINLDKSFIFEELLFKTFKGQEEALLGEFQFSYVTFLFAEIYESFEHWKDICLLLLNCQEVIAKHSAFFCNFLEVLYNQFRHFPKDFFFDELTSNNFFRKSLENFIFYIKDEDNEHIFPKNSKIKKTVIYFERFLNEFFGFFLKDEQTKILEKYLNKNNSDTTECLFFKSNNKDDEDDELPVIVDEQELNHILQEGIHMELETGENTYNNNTDIEAEETDNMDIDRF